ncbi:hypothetical protein [Streptomyces sp. TRM64462]|uniref:hypothetical protein n=1 Tax=Streptomyces sp. TRM64462 TaxID=2741726 RepID=UPI0020C7606A|nr:hypothetical protein [Streptomyces sp. TRM64462]
MVGGERVVCPCDAVEEQGAGLRGCVGSGFLQGGSGQGERFVFAAGVGPLVGERSGKVRGQGSVGSLAGSRDAESVGVFGVVVASGIAGYPPDDLGEFPDLYEQRAPHVVGVGVLAVEADGGAQFAKRWPDQVPAGQYVVSEP